MKHLQPIHKSRQAWFLLFLLSVTFLIFIGETLFNTKGEPREAVVALSMIKSGNWILPVSNGADIPYKPPMLAWIIAIFAKLTGGEITEYISRLPSALAAIAMIMCGFATVRRNSSTSVAMMMALITATSFEVHRAATNCRVDMLLTAFMVCGLYRLFTVSMRGKSLVDIFAILLLSGAVLTKGPVGAILPCGVIWIYLLCRGKKFLKTTISLAAVGILSFALPALWYVAAYQQGGNEFLSLVLEENFGRFTGTMSYESHVNPWWYNLITIIAGMLPYTIIALCAAFCIRIGKHTSIPTIASIWKRITSAKPLNLFMWTCIVVIFVFYCIPKSKRSVYLLPLYPMLAYQMALLIHHLYKSAPRLLKSYSAFIAALTFVIPALFFAIRIISPEVHSRSMQTTILGIESLPIKLLPAITIAIAFIMGIYTLRALFKQSARQSIRKAIVTTLTLYWSFSAIYQPAVLNIKSDLPVANEIKLKGYATPSKPLFGWHVDPMIRHYTIDFYLNDAIPEIKEITPQSKHILVGSYDFDELKAKYAETFSFKIVEQFNHRSCDSKQHLIIIEATPL